MVKRRWGSNHQLRFHSLDEADNLTVSKGLHPLRVLCGDELNAMWIFLGSSSPSARYPYAIDSCCLDAMTTNTPPATSLYTEL